MTPAGPGGIALVSRPPEAVLFRRRDGHLTARDFLADAHALAADLPDGGHVVNLCRDRYWFTVTLAACVLRGWVSLHTSERAPGQVRRLADRFGDAVSVADSAEVPSPLRHHVIRRGPGQTAAGTGMANPAVQPHQVAAIVFTSGTTGDPVGTPKTWGALAERSRDAGARFGMRPDAPASIVGTVPPQHMYGFETTVLQPLHAPASSWSGAAFYPLDVQEALAAVPPPAILVTTPLQMRTLLEAGIRVPALDRVISATAPLDAALAAEVERRWDTRVFEIFGATEVGSIASRRTVEGDVWTAYDRVRLEGASGDTVRVNAPYAEPRDLNDDLDLLDPARFRLLGRSSDIVKLGGRRASLAGLTSILNRIPGVQDGVFVAPDDLETRPTARLLAFVVAPNHPPGDILSLLREQIDPVFLPRRVVCVDALPRNELGKLPRDRLLALQARVGDE